MLYIQVSRKQLAVIYITTDSYLQVQTGAIHQIYLIRLNNKVYFIACVDNIGAILAVTDWHTGPQLTIRTLIKAYEVQGYFLLHNAFIS